MPRISSTASGTDITVEPRVISRPVSEMTDDELLAEVTALRGARGTTTAAARTEAKAKKESSSGPTILTEDDLW